MMHHKKKQAENLCLLYKLALHSSVNGFTLNVCVSSLIHPDITHSNNSGKTCGRQNL